ncbi:hypothetical protein PAXRUDRAFT_832972 [Paxillus rubicundulus Ve08.2h10]|uniref:Uncharacterized protein n=1 Tax=Paxillus rubicundulus Ve08.2h10 TaxID=930991 RepID=A0A0D0DQ23_9AGAM|nr:hypothetical protein PAXRUDRAFT_832972 [Paxillus rubicundulus Ve08.2h10]
MQGQAERSSTNLYFARVPGTPHFLARSTVRDCNNNGKLPQVPPLLSGMRFVAVGTQHQRQCQKNAGP